MGIFRRKAKASDTPAAPVDEKQLVDDEVGDDTADATSDVEDADTVGHEQDDAGETGDTHDSDDSDDSDELDDAGDHDGESDEARRADEGEEDSSERLPRPYPVDRSEGPFDRDEVDDLDDRLDFGSLAIVGIEGMELRLDVDDDNQQVTGLTAVVGQSACQLQAFAAPKSRGIWDGIRDDIADGLLSGGGTAEERLGPLGIELHVRMPGRGSDGRTTYSPARFIGVDGPRWFLRAVLSGAAAVDEAQAEPFLEYIRRVVVIRGGDARAPRQLLPLTVPAELVGEPDQPVEDADGAPNADDLKPFERGPEITEVQ